MIPLLDHRAGSSNAFSISHRRLIAHPAAKSSPAFARRREVEPGKKTLLAEDYVPIFRRLGVTCVIRFNKKCYDRRRFTEGGIKHHDLFYEDGGNPTEDIWKRFLCICEETQVDLSFVLFPLRIA